MMRFLAETVDMANRVLFVDDEPNVLQSIRRSLRKQFELDTANGGEEALEKMADDGPFAVVVSDMRMPGMNGVELLSAAKKRWPDTVRIMLTGNADQQTAVDAVNHGDVFRFLNKPCATTDLAQAVTIGFRQHELITAEKELLEKTLRGSIKALADILSLANPTVFGRTTRYKNRVSRLATKLGLENTWLFESAAMLSQIGCVSLSGDLIRRKDSGEALSAEEMVEFAAHANVGAELLKTIPRMEQISEAIRYQEKNFDGSGFPADAVKGEEIPLGARMLKIVADFDAAESSMEDAQYALNFLTQNSTKYDPAILDAFAQTIADAAKTTSRIVEISKLTDAMVLAEDVVTSEDVLLIAKGQETTLSARRHLQNYLQNGLIGESVQVIVPAQ